MNKNEEFVLYSNGRYFDGQGYTSYINEALTFEKNKTPDAFPAGRFDGDEVIVLPLEPEKKKSLRNIIIQENPTRFYNENLGWVDNLIDATTWYMPETPVLDINEPYIVEDYYNYISENCDLIVLVYFGKKMHNRPEYKSYVLKELVERPWLCGTWYGSINELTINGNVCNHDLNFRWRNHQQKKELLIEKVVKGYSIRSLINDLSEITYTEEVTKEEKNTFYSKSSLVNELIALSKRSFKKHTDEHIDLLTEDVLEKYQLTINKLSKTTGLEEFNKLVCVLYQLILRKVNDIESAFASDLSERSSVIQREQDFLDNIRSLVVLETSETENNTEDEIKVDIQDELGVHFEKLIDEEEMKKVKKLLRQSSNLISEVYKVTNEKTRSSFKKYLEENNGYPLNLFHGSLNENWWSICTTGLKVRPANVETVGSMFGDGIYLADAADKSINYTSLSRRGSWHNASGNSGFLAVYQAACKNPFDVWSYDDCPNGNSSNLNFDFIQKQNSDYVFAHKGNLLRRNEFVFYKDKQVDIKYIIKLKQND